MKSMTTARAAGGALLMLLGCRAPAPMTPPASTASVAPEPAPFAWTTTLDASHPLVGKVWDVRGHRFASPAAVYDAIGAADFIVLGEKHDNPDHHALQARALAAIVAKGKRPAVAFEMIETDAQGVVDSYVAGDRANAAGFGAAVDWEARGWPTYESYAPIVRVALEAHLPIRAANLPQHAMHELVHEGLHALSEADVARLGLDRPLPDEQAKDLLEEIKDSHCGMLPEKMLEPMALAQRARDAQLGSVMLASSRVGAVLIAGAGHARTDRGVPAWLAAHAAAGARVVSVAFREVDKAETSPGDEPYDFVWYTPRANDDDPCEGMHPKK